jgi:predicted small metal-binding protein
MSKVQLPPYLVRRNGKQRCSVCATPFAASSEQSVSKAFAEHVRKEHRSDLKQPVTHKHKEVKIA